MKKLFKTHPKHGSTQVIPYDPNEPTHTIAAAALVDVQAPIGSPYMNTGPSFGAAVPPSPDAALAQLATQRQAEYHAHHTQVSPQRERAYRNSRNVYPPPSSEDNWEVVQPSDYEQQQGHSPYLERKLSSNTGLPNPHPPVVPTTRSSSLNSNTSQPTPLPLAVPSPPSSSPYSASNSSPVIPQTSNPSIDSYSSQHMLRKKNRDLPQSDSRPPAGGGPAAILRALDSSAVPPQIQQPRQQQTIKLVQPTVGRPSIEVIPRSPTTDHTASFDDDRDSLEIERERKWRERDNEIFSSSEKKPKRKERSGLLQKVRPEDPVASPASGRTESKNLLERLHLQPDNETKKRRDGSHERSDKRRSREIDLLGSSREGKDVKEDKKLPWGSFLLGSKDKEKDKSRGRVKDRESDEQLGEEITRMIGFATAVATLDMTLVFEICDRASINEHCAKQASKALRRELKYGEPSGQISAARLWTIMLQNCSDLFIIQTSSRKFLDTLEDLVTGSRTPPLVRDALLNALGTAVSISISRGIRDHTFKEGYRSLWRKVKPPDMPDDGFPPSFEVRSPVTPTQPMPNAQRIQYNYRVTTSEQSLISEEQESRPRVRERLSSRNGIIPVDEDIRRLFQECKIGKGNAQLLSEALAFAKPEDLKEKGIIKEFHSKCLASQELVVAQIPWATAGAERSRLHALEERRLLGKDVANANTDTREERLLAELLKANEDLTEALKIYDDLAQMGIEKEIVKVATKRSQAETRMNGYMNEYDTQHGSSSFLLAPSTASSSSRSPSPTSIADPSYLDVSDAYSSSRNLPEPTPTTFRPPLITQASRPLPPNGTTRSPQITGIPHSHPVHARALHGPRMISSTGTRSRSPSPARSLLGSRPTSRAHSRNGSLEAGNDNTASKQSDVDSAMTGRSAPTGLSLGIMSMQVSDKAAGKRKMSLVDLSNIDDEHNRESLDLLNTEGPTFELSPQSPTDSPLTAHWKAHHPAQKYVYDAAAERTKEWLEHEHVAGVTAKH